MTHRVRTLLGLLATIALVAGSSAGASAGPLAGAARGGSAPATHPDQVLLFPGNLTAIRPLANDSDVEGDRLKVCALGPEKYPRLRIDVYEDQKDYYVTARKDAAPGTYSYTYYACDGTSKSPGTITVTVQKLPRITVRKIAGRPGRLRVTNGAPFRIRFLYGDYTRDDAEGDIGIPKKTSVVVSTRYTRVDWFALTADGGFTVGSGHVRDIRLPRVS